MIHGFSDHINLYNDMFRYLSDRGIAVFGFDQRGWGRSVLTPADKGNSGATPKVLAEIAAFIQRHIPSSSDGGTCADPASPASPLFVLGHSMGGGLAITLASRPEYQDSVVRHVRGWLLESPFIGFMKGEEPSALKVFLGRLACKFLPHHQLVERIPPEKLSRDPNVQKMVGSDPLSHDTGTLEAFAGLLDRAIGIDTGSIKMQKGQVRSLWHGAANADMVAGFEPQKKWFDSLGDIVEDKEFKVYDGWYHMIHLDVGKEEYFKDVANWILARSNNSDGTNKSKL